MNKEIGKELLCRLEKDAFRHNVIIHLSGSSSDKLRAAFTVLLDVFGKDLVFSVAKEFLDIPPAESPKTNEYAAMRVSPEVQFQNYLDRELNYEFMKKLNIEFVDGTTEMKRDGNTIRFGPVESKIMAFLLRLKKNEVVPYVFLIQLLPEAATNKNIQNHMKVIRPKLAALNEKTTHLGAIHIVNHRGYGYSLELE